MKSPATFLPDANPAELQRILDARHHDPFEVLGRHPLKKNQTANPSNNEIVRVFLPHAHDVTLNGIHAMERWKNTDLFLWRGPRAAGFHIWPNFVFNLH